MGQLFFESEHKYRGSLGKRVKSRLGSSLENFLNTSAFRGIRWHHYIIRNITTDRGIRDRVPGFPIPVKMSSNLIPLLDMDILSFGWFSLEGKYRV